MQKIVVKPIISEQGLPQSDAVRFSLSNVVHEAVNPLEIHLSLHPVDLVSPGTKKLT